jgi:hypothetical protein
MRSFLAIGLGGLVVLAACVGSDPGDTSSSSSSTSGGSSGAGSSSGATACAGDTIEACGPQCTKCTAPTDGKVACTGGQCVPSCDTLTLCGDACVDTKTKAEHCGKCGHSCGAGTCIASACQPITVATYTALHGIAASPKGIVMAGDSEVDLCTKPEGCTAATSITTIKGGVEALNSVTVAVTGTTSTVFWDGNEGDNEVVYTCPIDGCPAGLATTVDNIVNDTVGRVIAGPNTVLWTRRQSYYGPYAAKCTPPTCGTKDVVRPEGSSDYSADPARETTVPSTIFSVGATKTIWATGGLNNDNNKQLRYCTYGVSCATPTEISRGSFYGVRALTYFNGIHYVAMGNTTVTTSDIIGSISDASPDTPTALAGDAIGISDIAVDASGIYWVNGTTGKVFRCATLTGCAGSGEILAAGETAPKHIAVDDTYVYWANDTTVRKVAK